MAKKKQVEKGSNSKTKAIFDSIQKKNLKVVLYKNKYFHNEARNKDDLIKTLLTEKKKVLKLPQPTDNDLDSEDENKIHREEITKVLEDEKKSLFSNNFSDLDRSVPVEILEANKKWKKEQQQAVVFPAIPRKEINALLSILSTDKKLNKEKKNLQRCLAHLHTTAKPFWNSPSCIMKAIKDCILRRKWNNLTHLILMLIPINPYVLKPVVRQLCQILNRFNPVIEHAGLQNQLNMVYEANKR